MKLGKPTVYVTSYARAMHLVGAGCDPVGQFFAKSGDETPTWIFVGARAKRIDETYPDLRRQLSRVPNVSAPEPK